MGGTPRVVRALATAAAAVAATAAAAAASGATTGGPAEPAGAYPPPAVPVLPMDRYPVAAAPAGTPPGDAACQSRGVNVTALAAARMATIGKYGALKAAPDFDAYEQGMRALWDVDDPTIRVVVPAAGTYTGIENVLEYISLVVGSLNGGYVAFAGGDVRGFAYTPANASVSFTLAQTARYYCSAVPTATAAGTCETPALPTLSAHHVSFKPCTALLRQYVIAYDETATFLAARGATAVATCARHARWCTGGNAQYESFGECMAFMDGLPAFSCAEAIFQGDSAVCRFKHRYVFPFVFVSGEREGADAVPQETRSACQFPHSARPCIRGGTTD